MGLGGCLRDSFGSWIRGFSQSLEGGDALTAELKAISTGLQFLIRDNDQQHSKLVIETDSTAAINLILHDHTNRHPLRNTLHLCRHLLSKLQDHSFVKGSREHNKCVDKLAKDGRLKCLPLTIYDIVPDVIIPLYNANFSSILHD